MTETREEMLARFPDNTVGAIDADDSRALVNAVYDFSELGGAELVFEGDYVPATTYDDGDYVVKDGIVYVCVGGPTTDPPDVSLWGGGATGTAPSSPVSYGTSLPASPVNGQEAILVDSLTAPSYQWKFRYNAGSSHTHKWEYIGGAAWSAFEYAPTAALASGSGFTYLGPVFTIPRLGEYLLRHSSTGQSASTNTYVQLRWQTAGGALIGSGVDLALPAANFPGGLIMERRATINVTGEIGIGFQPQVQSSFNRERQHVIEPVRVS